MNDRYDAATAPGRGSGGRREREFRRYAEAVLGLRASRAGERAVSSIDVPLTAYAQLAALRLNAKRVIISLLDKEVQYILAEATQSLSLQRDDDHNEKDALFFGTNIFPRSDDWYTETVRVARKLRSKDGSSGASCVLILPDLAHDEKYSTHPHVVGAPFVRSYVGVPLISPTGYAVGTLSVLDDKPRPDGVPPGCVQVLSDIATSIMTHLDLTRTQTTHLRATRMLQGLSRFMEGKSCLFEDDVRVGEAPDDLLQRQGTQSQALDGSSRTHTFNDASNAERVEEARDGLFDRARTQLNNHKHGARRDLRPRTDAVPDRRASLPSICSQDRFMSKTRENDSAHPSIRPPQSQATQLQEDVLSSDVTQVFMRAANLIQQAMDMAGVIFLDASAGAFGSFRHSDADKASSNSDESVSTFLGSGSESVSQTDTATEDSQMQSKPCRHLASAYESDGEGSVRRSHHGFPERFLRSLTKRFPYGKIYNFGEDGLLSSDDHSDSGAAEASLPDLVRRRKATAYSDSAKLRNIFPGLRSFAVMPMWDEHKNRFLASAIVWSYNPSRLFSFQDDLNYVGAFCDVLMAEVGRVEVQADARAKASFISSISHELRSPLHGILGGVEFLQEDADDSALRQQMVQIIDSCGRSLLDIINNILDHAQVTNKKREPKRSRGRRSAASTASLGSVRDLALLAEEVLDSALWNTPHPATQSSSQVPRLKDSASHEPLKVILDVDLSNLPASGWKFHVNAGAFRRILQNLTTNAIKYTDNGGYFKCRLSMDNAAQRGNPAMVELDCTDSGRGMSQEYLRNGLWQAFNQEDSHAHGTGLGLSLVRSLVDDMHGTIDVQSTQNVGTSIKIRLPLTPGSSSDEGILSTDELLRINGMAFALDGFETSPGHDTRSSEATRFLRQSIEKICQYLGLRPHTHNAELPQLPDLYIVSERKAAAAVRTTLSAREPFQTRPCIILCDSVSSARVTSSLISPSMSQAIAVAQPLGPRQLLQALTSCLNKPATVIEEDLTHQQYNPESHTRTSSTEAATPMSDMSQMSWESVDSSTATPPTDASDTTHHHRPEPRPGLQRPSVSSAKSTALLVDDNPVNLSLLQRYMTKLGRQQVSATNGLEALEAYQNSHARTPTLTSPTPTNPISIIFMDITMPIMDGLESTRHIRAHERALGLKPAMIVALTALASPHARQEAHGSGVDLFLTKPVGFREIDRMFRDWEGEGEGDGGWVGREDGDGNFIDGMEFFFWM